MPLVGNGDYPVGPPLPDATFVVAETVEIGVGQVAAVHWASGGTALNFARWHDGENGLRCSGRADVDGVLRCLPEEKLRVSSFPIELYTQPGCVGDQVAAFEPCYEMPPPFVNQPLPVEDFCAPQRHLVRAIGDAIDLEQTEIYRLYDGDCSVFTPSASLEGFSYWTTSVVDPSGFSTLFRVTL
jgi:hypothetical protein